MQLRKLRPTSGSDHDQLRSLLEGRGWRSALPSSFPDVLLLGLAHDFRSVETSLAGKQSDDEVSALAAALSVVTKLLLEHPEHNGRCQALDLSEEGMAKALQLYQFGLERELVSRIVGPSSLDDTDRLLEALWQTISEDRARGS